MTNSTHRILGAATLAIIASAAASASAGAQAATPALDARWQAWAGCWTPVSQPGSPSEIGGSSTLCVVPAAGNSAVDVVTVVSGRVTGTTRIEADGQRHAVSRDGCTGTETAIWSTLGSRVFLTSELNCDGVARRSQSVMSFNQRYEWLDVQGITSGKNVGVAVTRYNPLPDATALPEELRVRVASRSAATNNAILAASAPLSLADIADVAIRVDSSLSTIWLAERTRDVKLSVTGKQLVLLADQGVPPAVIDAVVAIAYPENFVFQAGGAAPETAAPARYGQVASRSMGGGFGSSCYGSYSYWDPFWFDPYYAYQTGCNRFYGSSYYRAAYWGPGYYSPYGGYYYPGTQPIVVVNRPPEPSIGTSHGRVVNGRGYSSGGSSSGSSPSYSSGSSSGSGGSGSTAGSSSGSSSGSSGGGERTAVRKPPQ